MKTQFLFVLFIVSLLCGIHRGQTRIRFLAESPLEISELVLEKTETAPANFANLLRLISSLPSFNDPADILLVTDKTKTEALITFFHLTNRTILSNAPPVDLLNTVIS